MMISVIIPARNAAPTLPACLTALQACAADGVERPACEWIVVDDASDDDTAAVAGRFGARLIRLERHSGPSVARNRGAAAARGDVLFFIDADVQVRPGTLARLARGFQEVQSPDAIMGSYDDTPASRSFFSLYKNLFHHYVHQTSQPQAQTFWAGCGGICRAAFDAVGGFDETYRQPSVEDIELGYRLRQAGYRIRLDKQLQVTHLKHWTLRSMIATDIARRAVPWARLLRARGTLDPDLNLQYTHRLSAVLLFAAVGLTAAVPFLNVFGASGFGGAVWGLPLGLMGLVVWLNAPLYWFFARKVGPGFALRSIPVHCLYYLYSGAAYLWVVLTPAVQVARHAKAERGEGRRGRPSG